MTVTDPMNHAYLLTGSNRENPLLQLSIAANKISQSVGSILQISSIYKTAPWGNTDQDLFYNQVMQIETKLEPQKLLEVILAIETNMGRVREKKWEPRIIDIDILFFEDRILTGELQIPHPLLHLRRFTLVPLKQIAPDLIHPVLGKSITFLLDECPDKGMVVPN